MDIPFWCMKVYSYVHVSKQEKRMGWAFQIAPPQILMETFISFSAEFLFLLWSVYLCYAVRTVPSAFHEPRYMAVAVHIELIISAIFHIIRQVTHIVYFEVLSVQSKTINWVEMHVRRAQQKPFSPDKLRKALQIVSNGCKLYNVCLLLLQTAFFISSLFISAHLCMDKMWK